MEIFNFIAGVTSIAGCIASIWVLLRVRNIEKNYSRQALLPHYHDKLAAQVNNLKQHQKKKDASKVIRAGMQCRSILTDLVVHLDVKRATEVTRIISILGDSQQGDDNALGHCGHWIAELESVLMTVDNFIHEMRWRGRGNRSHTGE